MEALGVRQRSDDQDHVKGGVKVHVAVAVEVNDHVNVDLNEQAAASHRF